MVISDHLIVLHAFFTRSASTESPPELSVPKSLRHCTAWGSADTDTILTDPLFLPQTTFERRTRGSRVSCRQEVWFMSETSRQSEWHIDSIVRQEEEALERRSISERLADGVGIFAGSLPFVVLHLVFAIGWLLLNSGKIPKIPPFDPYPFSLLGVIVG